MPTVEKSPLKGMRHQPRQEAPPVDLGLVRRDTDSGEPVVDDELPAGLQGWHRGNVLGGKHLYMINYMLV